MTTNAPDPKPIPAPCRHRTWRHDDDGNTVCRGCGRDSVDLLHAAEQQVAGLIRERDAVIEDEQAAVEDAQAAEKNRRRVTCGRTSPACLKDKPTVTQPDPKPIPAPTESCPHWTYCPDCMEEINHDELRAAERDRDEWKERAINAEAKLREWHYGGIS